MTTATLDARRMSREYGDAPAMSWLVSDITDAERMAAGIPLDHVRKRKNRRLVRALIEAVEGFGESPTFTASMMEYALTSLEKFGSLSVPAVLTRDNQEVIIEDDVLDDFKTLEYARHMLGGVSKSTARRWLPEPDIILGQTHGWRVSTIREAYVHKILT